MSLEERARESSHDSRLAFTPQELAEAQRVGRTQSALRYCGRVGVPVALLTSTLYAPSMHLQKLDAFVLSSTVLVLVCSHYVHTLRVREQRSVLHELFNVDGASNYFGRTNRD